MHTYSPEQALPISTRAKSAAAVAVAMDLADVQAKELADLAGLATADLAGRLGARSAFNIDELVAIADALHVNVLSLLEAPTFTCPEWCVVSPEEHLAQLWTVGCKYDHRPVAHVVDDEIGHVGLSVYTDATGRPSGPTNAIFVIGDYAIDRETTAKLVETLSHYLTLTAP